MKIKAAKLRRSSSLILKAMATQNLMVSRIDFEFVINMGDSSYGVKSQIIPEQIQQSGNDTFLANDRGVFNYPLLLFCLFKKGGFAKKKVE